MGIKNLHKFLKKRSPEIYSPISLEKYRGKRIAVDINVYLYRYKTIHKDKWLSTFINFLYVLKKNGIESVFIYDTKAPMEKNDRKEERKLRKKNAELRITEIKTALEKYRETGEVMPVLYEINNKRCNRISLIEGINEESIEKELLCLDNKIVNITRGEIQITKDILTAFGIPHYDSESEAETLCSYFCVHGLVDAVLSDDTDVLVYGTPMFITKLNLFTETCIEIDYKMILNKLKLNGREFMDLCIMCGTDYNRNIHNIGNEKAYNYIQKYRSLEEIRAFTPVDVSILNYVRVREIFSVPEKLSDYDITNRPVDIEALDGIISKYSIMYNTEKIVLLDN